MKLLRKIYYRLFKRYRRLDYKFIGYREADILIRQNPGKPEHEQWLIAPEEDRNRAGAFLRMVHLERRERILS